MNWGQFHGCFADSVVTFCDSYTRSCTLNIIFAKKFAAEFNEFSENIEDKLN